MTVKPLFRSLALLVASLAVAGATQSPGKPNLLLIYSDDHGWADLGAQGVDKDIRTPHLDRLAEDGVRFSRGYMSAPQCVPSRAGVITGRYQQRFGLDLSETGGVKGPRVQRNFMPHAQRFNQVAPPVSGRLIRLRMNPGKNVSGIEIQSIDLRGNDGKSKTWRFDSVLEK